MTTSTCPDLVINELVVNGITHLCLAPGSRSTPLVLAAARHPKLHIHTHFDERSLGYFALGLAKATQTPVAILTTSGTAGANLYPAIIEAYYSHTPLLICTADRPFELWECGANQAIDQHQLFGQYSHFTTTIPTDADPKATLTTLNHAIHISRTKSGPVHLNWLFREPFNLEPAEVTTTTTTPYITYDTPVIDHYTPLISTASHPLICVGALPHATQQAVSKWIAKHNLFALTDTDTSLPISDTHFNSILHIGGAFIDGDFQKWLAKQDVPYLHIQNDHTRQNPSHLKKTVISANISVFLDTYTPQPQHPELAVSLSKKKQSRALHFQNWADSQSELSEPTLIHILNTTLPVSTPIFCANSLPIRALTRWGTQTYDHLYTNRGASGIEGNIATVAGIATSHDGPILALIGDQAALHDLNSLAWFQNTKKTVVILIINNFGGAIFTHMPIQKLPECETLFYRKHSLTFSHAASLFSLPYTPCSTPNEVTEQLKIALSHPGATIIEALCPHSTLLVKTAKELV